MQDLEAQIMNCWNVVDDIKSYLKAKHLDDDRVMNFLIGMQELYQVKFEDLWDTYSEALSDYYDLVQADAIKQYQEEQSADAESTWSAKEPGPTWRINTK
jgi:hypothetical protein